MQKKSSKNEPAIACDKNVIIDDLEMRSGGCECVSINIEIRFPIEFRMVKC